MKKRARKMIVFLTLVFSLITTVLPDMVYAGGMTYVKESKCISGAFTTLGTEGVTRIEIYVSNEYSYQDDNIILQDITSGAYFHLNGDLVTNQGTDTTTEIRYGGIVPINGYNMNCIIYYIVSASDISWEMKINKDNSLSECFIAKSKVPTNWETPYDAVITAPLDLLQYFIDSNASSFKNMDDVNALLNTQVQEAVVDESTFDGEIIEEEQKDPIVTLLLIMMAVVAIFIIITAYLLKKESAKKEAIRSEKYVAEANEKVKRKKEKENDELSELVSSYADDYTDDFVKDYEDVTEEQSWVEEEIVVPKENSIQNNVENHMNVQQSQMEEQINMRTQGPVQNKILNNQLQSQTNMQQQMQKEQQMHSQMQASPMEATAPPMNMYVQQMQQIPQNMQPPQNMQIPQPMEYGQIQMPGEYQNQNMMNQNMTNQNMHCNQHIPTQHILNNHQTENFQSQNIQNNQRINQQVKANPQKKVPAFARKQVK